MRNFKIPRRKKLGDNSNFDAIIKKLNQEVDKVIFRFLPPLKKRLEISAAK
jgi:hypothetical protein